MKRGCEIVTAFGLALFFASGLLCSTMAASGQSFASVIGCSQSDGAVELAGCEHPGYLCGFESTFDVVSRGAIGSTRSNNDAKNALTLTVWEISTASDGAVPLIAKECADAVSACKVSIRLFNSILNL